MADISFRERITSFVRINQAAKSLEIISDISQLF